MALDDPDGRPATGETSAARAGAIALLGFVVVATAQVSNMILARALAGAIPPFAIAFFRWAIIAASLAPFAAAAFRRGEFRRRHDACAIVAAGFCGMFLCGGPVYIAGVTTTAINIALIMSLSPVVVLGLSRLLGLERIGTVQALGMILALTGALIIVSRGDPRVLIETRMTRGDLIMLLPMLGWSAYTLLQSRVASRAGFLARVGVFAAAGALLTLPFAAWEAWTSPERVFTAAAAGAFAFAGLVPGVLCYAGFAYLGGKYGSVRSSLTLYIGPIASALLSFAILDEPPTAIHLIGGMAILGGVWTSLRR